MTTASANLGTYALKSGGFNGSGASYFQGIVGHAYNASTTTTNYYSSGNGTKAVFTYQMHVTVPSNAVITACYVMVNGHAESTSNGNEYMCVQLFKSNGTALTSQLNFKSIGTSNSTQTLNATTLPTASECAGMYLECTLGYYGGAINGATVYVEYHAGTQYSVTLTNNTSATVSVSDNAPYEGDDVLILSDTVSGIVITDNGTDITNQFALASPTTLSKVSSGSLSTSFTDSGGKFYISSSNSTTSYLEYAIGHTAESPGSSSTQNTYVKGNASGNTTTGTAIYSFDFSDIPSGATINSVTVKCYAAREDSSIDSTHVCKVGVYSGNTLKGAEQNISSTSYSIVTLSDVGTWTRSELQNAKFHLTLGYYGGRCTGITWTVVYQLDGYEYTITSIAANHVIVVSSSSSGPELYVKVNGIWKKVLTAYKKQNGSWSQVAVDQAFQSGTNYKRGTV